MLRLYKYSPLCIFMHCCLMKTESTKKVALIDIGATFFIFSVKKSQEITTLTYAVGSTYKALISIYSMLSHHIQYQCHNGESSSY